MDMRHRAANDGILIISSDCDYVQRDKMWKKKIDATSSHTLFIANLVHVCVD